MAKRPDHRSVRSTHSSTISGVLGISVGSVRGRIRSGLPAMVTQRPFLNLGGELRGLLGARRSKPKAPGAAIGRQFQGNGKSPQPVKTAAGQVFRILSGLANYERPKGPDQTTRPETKLTGAAA